MIYWCNFCNSQPSAGTLKALENGVETEYRLCYGCADKAMNGAAIEFLTEG